MLPNNKETKIFISYSSKDIGIAEELERYLQKENKEIEKEDKNAFDIWRDKREIETDWSKEIAEALAEIRHHSPRMDQKCFRIEIRKK